MIHLSFLNISRRAAQALSLCLILGSCGLGGGDIRFKSLSAEQTGIAFANTLTDTETQNIVEYLYYYNGGGVAAGDVNNDGLVDLVFTANQLADELYINEGNLSFRRVVLEEAFDGKWSTGVTMADVNGDGLLDIYICRVGDYKSFTGRNSLYINQGDGAFEEKAAEFGLDFQGFSTQASFFDYDRDGDLDMYLLNNAVHTIRSYAPANTRTSFDPKAGDRLFQSQLVDGEQQFIDVSKEVGIYSSSLGYGLGLVCSDVNGDGWMDIYVGNDFHENDYLYINHQNGQFRESLTDYIQHTSRFSMGVDVADVDGDTHRDVFTLDMLPHSNEILLKSAGEDNNQVSERKIGFGYNHQFARNNFQLNQGGGSFSEVALITDTYATDWSWSVLIEDYDNDGSNDIFITNGIYKRPNDLDYINYMSNQQGRPDARDWEDLIANMPTLQISNVMYSNKGDLSFESVGEKWGLSAPSYSNGAAYADLDNDGDLDIAINNLNSTAQVFENVTSSGSEAPNWLMVELEGPGLNKLGVGAVVRAHVNGKVIEKELSLSRGFQSSVPPVLHFGLGTTTAVDSLVVRWSDGTLQSEAAIPGNQKVSIAYRESGRTYSAGAELGSKTTMVEVTQVVDNDFNHFNFEPLVPFNLGTEGPAFTTADINGDGLEDLFLGGAHNYAGRILTQTEEGTFDEQQVFSADSVYEDTDAAFFDVDNDGDQDLYVVSGGAEYLEGSLILADRIYINNDGKFEQTAYQVLTSNGACVRPMDFDGDGDMDLFVGSRSIPGAYGLSPFSYILENQEGGIFVADTLELGMVTDAQAVDYNQDGAMDLVVVGDWMPVTVLENTESGWVNRTEDLGLTDTQGWWRSVTAEDVDGDGRLDIIAGNLGENSKLKASIEEPANLYVADFDNNSYTDPIIFYYLNGESIPFAGKDDLVRQIAALKKGYLKYEDFAKVRSIRTLLGPMFRSDMTTLPVKQGASSVFLGGENGFTRKDLPFEAQLSPIFDVEVGDLNGDGFKDLVAVGNFFGATTQLGRFDANAGATYLGDGAGNFQFKSRLSIPANEENRHVERVGDLWIFVPNEGAVRSTDKLLENAPIP